MMRIVAAILLLAGLCAGIADAKEGDTTDSIYQLDAKLTDQAGHAQGLDLYRGSPVLITLFYGSCQATCPLIIDTLRSTERGLTPEQRARVRVLMISFDPERDTPAALREIAAMRRIDGTRWTLATADAATVREIAALLDVQYRKLPNGEFSHSAVITLLSPRGEIEARSTQIGRADPALLARLHH
jgi:protein SCO1/2